MLVSSLLPSSLSPDDLYIEDIEVPCGQPVIHQQLVSKVLVQNIPAEYRNIVLQYYLEKLVHNSANCKLELFQVDGVATFQPPIGTLPQVNH